MSRIVRWLGIGFSSAFFLLSLVAAQAASASPTAGGHLQQSADEHIRELPGRGQQCNIDDQHYFFYEFPAKPKPGTPILKVKVFSSGDKRTTDFAVSARYGMLSSPGARDSGDRELKPDKKMDYLLPVNITAPGEWEVRLTFEKDGEVVLRGSFRFNA